MHAFVVLSSSVGNCSGKGHTPLDGIWGVRRPLYTIIENPTKRPNEGKNTCRKRSFVEVARPVGCDSEQLAEMDKAPFPAGVLSFVRPFGRVLDDGVQRPPHAPYAVERGVALARAVANAAAEYHECVH